jgi:hypothetical protein
MGIRILNIIFNDHFRGELSAWLYLTEEFGKTSALSRLLWCISSALHQTYLTRANST